MPLFTLTLLAMPRAAGRPTRAVSLGVRTPLSGGVVPSPARRELRRAHALLGRGRPLSSTSPRPARRGRALGLAVAAAGDWPGGAPHGPTAPDTEATPERVLRAWGVPETAAYALATEAARCPHPSTTSAQHALDVIAALRSGGVAVESISCVLQACPRLLSCPAEKVQDAIQNLEQAPAQTMAQWVRLSSDDMIEKLADDLEDNLFLTVGESSYTAGDFIVEAARAGQLEELLGKLSQDLNWGRGP